MTFHGTLAKMNDFFVRNLCKTNVPSRHDGKNTWKTIFGVRETTALKEEQNKRAEQNILPPAFVFILGSCTAARKNKKKHIGIVIM